MESVLNCDQMRCRDTHHNNRLAFEIGRNGWCQISKRGGSGGASGIHQFTYPELFQVIMTRYIRFIPSTAHKGVEQLCQNAIFFTEYPYVSIYVAIFLFQFKCKSLGHKHCISPGSVRFAIVRWFFLELRNKWILMPDPRWRQLWPRWRSFEKAITTGSSLLSSIFRVEPVPYLFS